jgi:hypothetical protein
MDKHRLWAGSALLIAYLVLESLAGVRTWPTVAIMVPAVFLIIISFAEDSKA